VIFRSDKREGNPKAIIDNIQTMVFGAVLYVESCTAVCPKGIDPKMDITMLRGDSVTHGYSDPSFATQSFGTPNFGEGFGFNPNDRF